EAPAGSGGRVALSWVSSANSAGANGMTTAAVPTRSTRNTSNVTPPRRPTALTSTVDATPVITSDTTSGITVIRMALTQIVPIGAIESAAATSDAFADAAIAAPSPTALPSATSTRVLSFMVARYIIRSPPLMSNDAPVM